ncbi:sigma-54-dependent Fis family transcriptional regulator [Bacillus sp. EB01]|uniref:sigma-54-dependent Fis family transcriptional regulator n=1 Tax=Bacillus sp. EB01 TaxID=1347086 RepID=UPI0005C75FDD|nr:sigma-54-dependent Fis family transcriptional regulator [Bacillus sp. EB01]
MKIKIHIVAPYEAMISVIKECTSLFPTFHINYSVGDLTEGVKQAIQAEKDGSDIIISRGGTAQLIKKSVRIPVIDMHLSGYDMIRSLSLVNNLGNKTAIVGFSNITSGAQSIIDLLDYPLKVYTVSSSDEVVPLVLKLKSSGFQQIVGDVITVRTSNELGLRGFLIQSGKESIIKALEDAKLLYGYMAHQNILKQAFEQLVQKDNLNFMIIDNEDRIIYELWTDFHSNPLSKNQLQLALTDLKVINEITGSFVINANPIDFRGHVLTIQKQRYKAIVIEKNTISKLEHKGLKIHSEIVSEPIAAASASMGTIINHLETLYKNNEMILLQGKKGTGKEFLTHYIHKKCSDRRMLLAIDFEQFDIDHLEDLPLSSVGTIKFTHTEYLDDGQKFTQFLRECQKKNIRVFVIAENTFTFAENHMAKVNKIILPDLSERKEDIEDLAQYFIAYYHQHYGTKAVKISREALNLLEGYTYPNNIDDLKNLIKQIVLNEKDYVILRETVERIGYNDSLPADIIFQKGTLSEIEKEIIKWVLKAENNNQTKAAERLGINRATLWRKLKD